MNNLKELTWEHHKKAERQGFVKELLGGISAERYATYLFNQHPQYNLLETLAMMHGLFDGFPDLRRAPKIHEDYQELWTDKSSQPVLLPVVKEYMDHLMTIKDDSKKLMAHVYVRHMGDLSGGQMIAKRVPGEGRFYKFDTDVDTLKTHIKSQTDDSMAEEAKLCFDFATKLFEQMEQAENK
jgi:heme oxygenase (biliverdin-producing, ferredoxin)